MRIARYFFRKAAHLTRHVKLTAFAVLVCTLSSDGAGENYLIALAKSLEKQAYDMRRQTWDKASELRDRINIRNNSDVEKYYRLRWSVEETGKQSLSMHLRLDSVIQSFEADFRVYLHIDEPCMKCLSEKRKNYEYWMGRRSREQDNEGRGAGAAKYVKDMLDDFIKKITALRYAVANVAAPVDLANIEGYPEELKCSIESASFDPWLPMQENLTWEQYNFRGASAIANLVMLNKWKLDILREEERLLDLINDRCQSTLDEKVVSVLSVPTIRFGSQFPYQLFRHCANRVRIEISNLSDTVTPLYSCQGGEIRIDPDNPMQLTLYPQDKKFYLTMILQKDGKPIKEDTLEFRVVEPPAPEIKWYVGNCRRLKFEECRKVYFDSNIRIELHPNNEFAAVFPDEVRYQIVNVRPWKKTIGPMLINGYNFNSLASQYPIVEIELFHILKEEDIFDILIEIGDVYRTNSNGQKYEDNELGAREKNAIFFLDRKK